MSKKIIYLFMFSVLFFVHLGNAQKTDTSGLVKYTPEFKFKDGIFLNFDQVKNNNPIPKSRIIVDFGYNEPDFFDRILQNKKIYFFDHIGSRQEVSSKK
ncbi:MAG: hypothetical protein HC906_13430 [Bacteroidales bacterium]|nr:hypothetical protein [Bacteroidales bacterium]